MSLLRLRLRNLLSFGPDAEAIPLGPLNVIIGPNGSGKSNLIEAVGLLAATPQSLSDALRQGGGVADWLWKGSKGTPEARIEVLVTTPDSTLRHELEFSQVGQVSMLTDETIEATRDSLGTIPTLYFGYINGKPHLRPRHAQGSFEIRKGFNASESILAQRRDPDAYPELYQLGEMYSSFRLYRDWTFGRYAPARQPQPADLPNAYLDPDAVNLGLVLNRIRKVPDAKEALLKHLGAVYAGVRDVDVSIEGGTVQVFLHENRWVVPANRLSDGTLRWLSLLAILLNPSAQSLVCIEEPEIGLHPDLLPLLAQLLREASERMQLIVTTHSDALVDALSDTPESVLVCEKHEGSTAMRRLDRTALSEWLKDYTLGQLWRRGEIGGNRW
jgi:predicted ATPase